MWVGTEWVRRVQYMHRYDPPEAVTTERDGYFLTLRVRNECGQEPSGHDV